MRHERYVFTSSSSMHWIGLENRFGDSIQLCSPDYGEEFLARNMEGIMQFDGVVAVFFNENIESLLHAHGVPICFPSAKVRGAIEDKCEAVRLAMDAGVRLAPTLLAKIKGYAHLCQLVERAGMGMNIVVQIPSGNSGKGTFTIANPSDYNKHAHLIESARECRVMKKLNKPSSFCIETVMTDAGTVIGMPALDLIGIPELTPNPNGWCGNVIGRGTMDPQVAVKIREDSLKISLSAKHRHPSFFGYSGDDYLLTPGEDLPVYQEKNARCTGLMPLSNVAAIELGVPPLIAQHLDQYEGNGARIDVDGLNQRWSKLEDVGITTCLIVKQLDHRSPTIQAIPARGIYSLEPDGLRYDADSWAVAEILNYPSRALWIPETTGQNVRPQDVLGRLLLHEPVTVGHGLNARGKAWIRAFREAMNGQSEPG